MRKIKYAALVSLSLGVLPLGASQVAAKPNFVIILTDDQDDTGSMKYMPKVHSLLAEHGLTFTNSFVNFSLCSPSRLSFLSGQAAHNNTLRSDKEPMEGWAAFRLKENNLLPDWLVDAGYKTALVGRYLNGYLMPTRVPPGWTRWFQTTSYFNYKANDDGRTIKFDHGPSDYSTDVICNRAVQFIDEQAKQEEPFFLLITTTAPHIDHKNKADSRLEHRATPAPRHEKLFTDVTVPPNPAFNEADVSDKPGWLQQMPAIDAKGARDLDEAYRESVRALQAVDDLTQSVVEALQRAGRLKDTFIIYTSDNGFIYGQHRLWSKFDGYEGSIKVPLIFRGPGIAENQTRKQLVNNLDITATIEQLAELEPGLTPDGHSLVPLFSDPDASWRTAIGFEAPDPDIRPGRRFFGVRTKDRKYIKYDDGFEELYDLAADPNELENKARVESYSSELTILRQLDETLKACAGRRCWLTP